MTRALVVMVALALVAGCVHYPTVDEAGGPRIRPENGRAARGADGLNVFVDLHSTGKFGDVLMGAQSTVAREAKLVDQSGAVLPRLEIPGVTVVPLRPDGPHVRLSNLTRQLNPGEVVIVTLLFQKSGNVGVVTVVE